MERKENISHSLHDIRKKPPFVVPDHYFEEFSDRLNNRIHNRKSPAEKRMLLWRPYAAAAILIIVALVSGNVIFNKNRDKRAYEHFHAAIHSTVEMELYSISEETIMEAMENSKSGSSESAETADEMIDYLLDADVNEVDMLNAL